MIKLSKKVEYALMAAQHMAAHPGVVVSAKDIAANFEVSQALVAKVLQSLVRADIVRSYHGANGGYELLADAAKTSIADVIEAVEGKHGAIVQCQEIDHVGCEVHESCTIREPLAIMQERINATFATMSIAELVQTKPTEEPLVQLEIS